MNSRRTFIKSAAGTVGLVTLSTLVSASTRQNVEPKKILVTGGHPDDPECGAGGTIALLAEAGHEVVILYLTNGQEGIEDQDHDGAGRIRIEESVQACKLLGARPLFAGQVDGNSVVSNEEMNRFQRIIWDEAPDVVLTHWPIDSHKDHQVCSLLTMQSWQESPKPFSLYFYEVCAGYQTFLFHPTDYVDITAVMDLKKRSLAAHASQQLMDEVGGYTQMMVDCGQPSTEDFRGKEFGVDYAEAFIRMVGKGNGGLRV